MLDSSTQRDNFIQEIRVETCDTLFYICGYGACTVCGEKKEGQKWHFRYKHSSQWHPCCGDLMCIIKLRRNMKSSVFKVEEFMEQSKTQKASLARAEP